MTVYGLVASLAWTATAVLFVSKLEHFANRWLGAQPKSTTNDVVIPADLVGLALAETEDWAQESTRKAILQQYEKFHDWNQVRASIGVAQVHT